MNMRKPMHNRGDRGDRGDRGGRGGPRRYNNHRGGSGGHYNAHVVDDDGISQHQKRNARAFHNKYMTMARDAASSGDRVLAEYYLQHADHYVRIMNDQQERYRNNGTEAAVPAAEGNYASDNTQEQRPQRGGGRRYQRHASSFPEEGAPPREQSHHVPAEASEPMEDLPPGAAFGEHLPAFLYGRVVSNTSASRSQSGRPPEENE